MLRYNLEQCQQFGTITKIESLRITSKGLVGSVRYERDSHLETDLYKMLSDEDAILWNGCMLELRNVRLNNLREFIAEDLVNAQVVEMTLDSYSLCHYLTEASKDYYRVGDTAVMQLSFNSFVLITNIINFCYPPKTFNNSLVKNTILKIALSHEDTVLSDSTITYKGIVFYSRKMLYKNLNLIQEAIKMLEESHA